jgi:hypothetical protein
LNPHIADQRRDFLLRGFVVSAVDEIGQRFGTGLRMAHDQVTIVLAHRQGTRHHCLTGQTAGLLQHIVDARPMDGEQQHIMASPREQRAELAAHQSGTQNANTHGTRTRRQPVPFRHNSHPVRKARAALPSQL